MQNKKDACGLYSQLAKIKEFTECIQSAKTYFVIWNEKYMLMQ